MTDLESKLHLKAPPLQAYRIMLPDRVVAAWAAAGAAMRASPTGAMLAAAGAAMRASPTGAMLAGCLLAAFDLPAAMSISIVRAAMAAR